MVQRTEMHRDPTLVKRNALVIPGVLLVLLALAGIVYAQFVRPDTVECEDGTQVVLLGACRSAALLLAVPLVIGLVLIILGARLRSGASCHLGHGTGAAVGLSILLALFLLPLIAAMGLYLTQDPDAPYVITYNELEYGQADILFGAAAVGFLVMVPYLILYLGTSRPPACCRERGCFEPCYCDEGTPAPEAAAPPTFESLPPAPAATTWTGPPPHEAQASAVTPAVAHPLPPAEPWTAPLPPPVVPAPEGVPAVPEAAPAASPATTWEAADEDVEAPAEDEGTPSKPAKASKAKGKRKVTRRKKA